MATMAGESGLEVSSNMAVDKAGVDSENPLQSPTAGDPTSGKERSVGVEPIFED